MNLSDLAEDIFDALQEFDRSSAPFGLYAAGDLAGEEPQWGRKGFSAQKLEVWKMRRYHPEWEGAIEPYFKELQAVAVEGYYPWNNFTIPSVGGVNFLLKRISKIKVREYGSKYHVDKHENFVERWDDLKMDKAIAALWSSQNTDSQLRLLLFLGFDKASRPFERELNDLKPHQTRASHGIEFFERAWVDSIGRGFKIRAALWAHHLREPGCTTF